MIVYSVHISKYRDGIQQRERVEWAVFLNLQNTSAIMKPALLVIFTLISSMLAACLSHLKFFDLSTKNIR